jgi:pantothenate synthetase
MRVIHTVAELRQALAGTSSASLVRLADEGGGPVQASKSVDRLQFPPPTEIVTGETARAEDGLALLSRNG